MIRASISVNGVFPEPPTARFPMLMTGTVALTMLKKPLSKQWFLIVITDPYIWTLHSRVLGTRKLRNLCILFLCDFEVWRLIYTQCES